MEKASQRLINKANEFEKSKIGIGLESIGKITCNPQIIGDLFDCLKNTDVEEIKWGLWFCLGFLKSETLPPDIVADLKALLPSFVTHSNPEVRARVVGCLALSVQKHPKFREWMLGFLKDEDVSVRWESLSWCNTFLKPGEIEPLLSFQNDNYTSEISMCGPIHYLFRDWALERIEASIGTQFPKNKLTEIRDGVVVFWWDWSPFLKWHEKRKKGWFSWMR